MSQLETLIIPLIDSSLTKKDFSKESGFVGLYTRDKDNPIEGYIYLLYDFSKRTEQMNKTYVKLSYLKSLRKSFIRYINGVAHDVFCFVVPDSYKTLYHGLTYLTGGQKLDVIKFWESIDVTRMVLDLNPIQIEYMYEMPPNDYQPSIYEVFKKYGIKNNKGDGLTIETAPFYFLISFFCL